MCFTCGQNHFAYYGSYDVLFRHTIREVTKISSFQVNTSTKSNRGIKLLRISFGSIFLLFSYESSQGLHSKQPGEILPGPQLSMTALQSLML